MTPQRQGDEATAAATAADGRTLGGGKYRVLRVIGKGAMGVVYEAEQTALERRVAIKLLHAAVTERPQAHERFRREALAASRIEHPNSTRIFDFGEEPDGGCYIVMELLDGETLGAIADAEGRLTLERTAALLGQALGAVAVAHEAGIVHRDLKPDNIVVVRGTDDQGAAEERAKVCDFGIAKLAGSSQGGAALTQEGTISGTPHYMAPEQCQGKPLDARADLYACGVIAYRLLVGELPFGGENAFAVVYRHITEPPPTASERNPALGPAVDAFLARALAKAPADRFVNAREMRGALAALVHDPRARGADGGRARPATPTYRRSPSQDATLDFEAVDAAGAAAVDKDAAPAAPTTEAAPAPTAAVAAAAAARPWRPGLALTATVAVVVAAAALALHGWSSRLDGGAGAGGDRDELRAPAGPRATAPAPTAPEPAAAAAEVAAPIAAAPQADRPGAAAVAAAAAAGDATGERGAAAAEPGGIPPAPQVAAPAVLAPQGPDEAGTVAPELPTRRRGAPRSVVPPRTPPPTAGAAAAAEQAPAVAAPQTPAPPEPHVPPPAAALPAPTAAAAPPAPAAAALAREAPPLVPPPEPAFNPQPAIALSGVEVDGGLARAAIQHALAGLTAACGACWRQAAARADWRRPATVKLTFEIDEDGRLRGVAGRGGPAGLAACVADAAALLRSRERPDTGTARGAAILEFRP